MQEEFQMGSCVQSIAGSPKMVIERFIGDNPEVFGNRIVDEYLTKFAGFENGDVICQWFDQNQLKRGTFKRESLILC